MEYHQKLKRATTIEEVQEIYNEEFKTWWQRLKNNSLRKEEGNS